MFGSDSSHFVVNEVENLGMASIKRGASSASTACSARWSPSVIRRIFFTAKAN
jgi:hypothetical protein